LPLALVSVSAAPWLDIEFDAKHRARDVITAARKIPVTSLMFALGLTAEIQS